MGHSPTPAGSEGGAAVERVTRRDGYRPPEFLVDAVRLLFDLDAAETRVECTLSLRRNSSAGAGAALRLDGEDLALESLALDGRPLAPGAFTEELYGLRIADVPDRFELSTVVRIRPDRNSELMGLYCAGPLLCTQCEPEAFRRITFFPDRPDVLAVFTTTLIADEGRYPLLLANGNAIDRGDLEDGRHRVTWHNPHPMPSYLFALVAGDLDCRSDRVETGRGRPVSVNVYVERGNGDRCEHALSTIKRAMAWDERRYGREYDLDTFNAVAVSAYTMGAMENKGLNIFNDRYVLADPATATDDDYRAIEAMVAHEYLHNWTGNRVTCRDWFQLALKEGFTVFREQQFVAEQGWGETRRLEDAVLMGTRQFQEDAGPLAHSVRPASYRRIDNFYTDTVYSKGAELIRMLLVLVGDEGFRRGTDEFFASHDGDAATVEDFLACMASASGRDLEQFSRWYDRVGTPRVQVTLSYEPASASATLRVCQAPARAGDEPLHLPLAVALLGQEGRRLPLRLAGSTDPPADSMVLELREPMQSFCFEGIGERPVPSLLRGFSAPVELACDFSEAELVTLALHDDDAFTRWDAVRRLVTRELQGRIAGGASAPAALARVFGGLLEQADRDPLLAADLLSLPSEQLLAGWFAEPDYEALHVAREALRRELGEGLLDAWRGAIRPPGSGRRGPPTPRDVGWRRLSDLALAYWLATGDPDAAAHAERQWAQAGSMSEALAALGLLAEGDAPGVGGLLQAFRGRWEHEPLVMDRWLALQARCPDGDTVAKVRRLMDDPLFSLAQPNRVRALIETFCTDNPRQFHRPDGAGYQLLADCVLAIDPENPPLAAGLLRHLVAWRRQEPGRRKRMRAELLRVSETAALSGMSTEIANAALGP